MPHRNSIAGGIVHTHLKGRIFNNEGVSYLVLNEENPSPELLRVKALNPGKQIQEMRAEDVRRLLPEFQPNPS